MGDNFGLYCRYEITNVEKCVCSENRNGMFCDQLLQSGFEMWKIALIFLVAIILIIILLWFCFQRIECEGQEGQHLERRFQSIRLKSKVIKKSPSVQKSDIPNETDINQTQ